MHPQFWNPIIILYYRQIDIIDKLWMLNNLRPFKLSNKHGLGSLN